MIRIVRSKISKYINRNAFSERVFWCDETLEMRKCQIKIQLWLIKNVYSWVCWDITKKRKNKEGVRIRTLECTQ